MTKNFLSSLHFPFETLLFDFQKLRGRQIPPSKMDGKYGNLNIKKEGDKYPKECNGNIINFLLC